MATSSSASISKAAASSPVSGSIAVLEFQALTRGVSPLSVQDVTYVEDAGGDKAAVPEVYEGSITVD